VEVKAELEGPADGYLLLAEFVTQKKERTDVKVGMTFPVDAFEADTRCKKNPLRRFVLGNATPARANAVTDTEEEQEGTCEFVKREATVFKFKPTCWHYSWRSNKHATNTQHWLRTFAFEIDATRTFMTCVAMIDTTPFTLFSSKILDKSTSKRKTPEQIKAAQQAKRARKAAALAASGGLPIKKPARPLKRLKVAKRATTVTLDQTWFDTPGSPVSVALYDDMMATSIAPCVDMSLDDLVNKLEQDCDERCLTAEQQPRFISCPPPLIDDNFKLFDQFDPLSLILEDTDALPFR
jgi:hypothetical protein